MRLETFLARIRRATTTAELFATVEVTAHRAGFDYLAYAALKDHARYGAPAHPAPAVMLTYPQDWVDRYFGRGYEKIDPVLIHTIGIGVPYLWSWLPKLWRLDGKQSQVLEEARTAGLAQGMTVPLIGPASARALLSYATPDGTRDIEPQLGRLGIHAALFHIAFVEMAGVVRQALPAEPLRPMEGACLKWVAEGKTAWETAVILGLSEATVRAYLRRARRKLGATTQAMAVARAMHLGLIDT